MPFITAASGAEFWLLPHKGNNLATLNKILAMVIISTLLASCGSSEPAETPVLATMLQDHPMLIELLEGAQVFFSDDSDLLKIYTL